MKFFRFNTTTGAHLGVDLNGERFDFTAQMKRKAKDLAEWLFREIQFPAVVFPFTGTEGDIVAITIEGMGTLENTVAHQS